jgi:ethanolamine utilization protein EutA
MKKYEGLQNVEHIVFSGGVAEYVYGFHPTGYGDLGLLLGRSIREKLDRMPKEDFLRQPVEGIRATVIGAGEYTIQASGNTSYVSSLRVLPVHGLKVIRPLLHSGALVDESIEEALKKFDLDSLGEGLALAIAVRGLPDYPYLRQIARGIDAVLKKRGTPGAPVYIVLDLDVAKSLGGILKEELKLQREVVAVDGIDVGDLDYIDLGRPVMGSDVLPVTVKSLLFPPVTDASAAISPKVSEREGSPP